MRQGPEWQGGRKEREGFATSRSLILGNSKGSVFPNVEVTLNHGGGGLNPALARGSRERSRPAAHPA
jgi:hypothetical protein